MLTFAEYLRSVESHRQPTRLGSVYRTFHLMSVNGAIIRCRDSNRFSDWARDLSEDPSYTDEGVCDLAQAHTAWAVAQHKALALSELPFKNPNTRIVPPPNASF